MKAGRWCLQRCARAVAVVVNHHALRKAVGGRFLAKHHLLWECAVAMPDTGNPRFDSTYADESVNSVWKKGVTQSTRPQHCGRQALAKHQVLCMCAGQQA